LTNDGSDGINPFITAADIPPVTGFVPYTGATANVDLGTHTLSAKDLVINHSSGSGVAASITKGGAGEALTINKTSGSGNAMSVTGGVTQLDELHLTTDLADAYIASAATWNGKFTLPALTSGSVLFSNGTTIAQDNSNLFWDNTNNRLSIGANTLLGVLNLVGQDPSIPVLTQSYYVNTQGNAPGFTLQRARGTIASPSSLLSDDVIGGFFASGYHSGGAFGANTTAFRFVASQNFTSTSQGTRIEFFTTPNGSTTRAERLRIADTGNVLINTTTDSGFKLDVNGTARVSGTTTTQSILPVTTQTYNIGSGTSQFSAIYSNVFQSNGTSIIRSGASSNLIFQANGGTEVARFTTGLNLLVGTTTDIASSKLTIASTTQGFLPPRMTNAQRLAIATPAVGLMVYCTDMVEGLYVNKSTGWTFVI